ncbi:MAG: hypothetical protein H0X62_15990 [Bacteroidetes bacterium]|nr:hypothetical protein [Bacteroidota bacterium]
MKVTALLILLLYISLLNCPAQTFEWAIANAYNAFNKDSNVSTDAEGNIYTSTLCYNYSRHSDNQWVSGIVISKYAPNGNVIWSDTATGIYSVRTVADAKGNLYLTGIGFGNIKLGSYAYYAHPSESFFAKFTSSGKCAWVKFLPDGGGVHITANNKTGGGYMIGGAKSIGNIYFNSGFNRDGYYHFFARFDEEGEFLWANTVDFPGWGGVAANTNIVRTNNSLCSDKEGNLYIGATALIDSVNYTYLEKINENGESQYFYKFPTSNIRPPSSFCVNNVALNLR